MADFLIGQQLGVYEIIGLLGQGGMATVYRARQTLAGRVQREVAIKVMETRLAQRDEFVARFEREAQTIVSLSHAHILKVFDYGQHGHLLYLVMELLPGGSLADRIKRGPLPVHLAVRLLDQIADALDFAHSKGIVHRDLKPQNVLLDESGDAFLSDFGIVKLLNETAGLTQSGVAVGTPAYMAPEQWQAGIVDARTDIYSLGAMLFEMVSGHVPFQADTPFHMMHKHIYEQLPSASVTRPELTPNVDRVLDKALAKNPLERYSSAGALAKAFREALLTSSAQPQPASVVEQPTVVDFVPTVSAQPLFPIAASVQGSRNRLVIGSVVLTGIVVLVIGLIALLINQNKSNGIGTGIASTATVEVAVLPTNTSSGTSQSAVIPVLPSVVTVTETLTTTLSPTVSPLPPTSSVIPTNTFTQTVQSSTLTPAATATTVAPTEVPIVNTVNPMPTVMPTAIPTLTSTVLLTVAPTAIPTIAPSVTASTMPTLLLPTIAPTATRAPGDTRLDAADIAQVYVPVGCFRMGSEGNDKDELPVHKVCITKPFWLDQTQVSNESFNRYLTATGAKAAKALPTGFDSPSQPRVNVSWVEAVGYANWRGCRLPTEAEWEWADRGTLDLIWPWGNDRSPGKAQTAESKPDRTTDVTSYTNGKSWVNAYQMAGNVWEWLNDWYDENYYSTSPVNDPTGPTTAKQFRVLRGGSFRQDLSAARGSDRYWAPPDGQADFVGFRIACSIN